MSMSTLLGNIAFNPRGVTFFGQPGTAITLDFEDDALGFVWHLRYRKTGGDWEQFYVSDPVLSTTQRQAFVDFVNSYGRTPFLQAVAATINVQITGKFGEYIGAGTPLPAPVPPGPVTLTTLVPTIKSDLVNNMKFALAANGILTMVPK